MHIPEFNRLTDRNEIVDFMKQFSFANIVSAKDNLPVATPLPFLIKVKDEQIILTSHFAKANDHWKDIENNQVLIIFSEPHAYISPVNYDKDLNVPTWNYISVHAYGKGTLITESEKVAEILEATIENYEPTYRKQWDNFPEEYKSKMSKGIVAFEIVVTDIKAKDKLSQNRSETEKLRIIETLSKSEDSNERQIATFMKKEFH
ncbi:FMN-binding negative transcriptional regulator [Daejeonella sp.]|uniref:FMN-binding negative transcriptional regulator n=1 Tax=Daejeonella sp. TaxID=2805397 RepID=UPI00272FB49A|nr:FMN-binding negative transcriptional regulator [Daejeonella sp.]MDP2415034.1 FMN-binding negative transcriptional regulator [Daejeonella sp.]